ncbi:hypothetical protein [Solimonas soli]|nr:hypothetical protein [Solimonas soli]
MVISADAVNRPRGFMVARKQIADCIEGDAAQPADGSFAPKAQPP